MRVKVGDRVYDGNDEPVMAILSLKDKENIANMTKDGAKYCSYPAEKFTTEQIKKWMSEETSAINEYEIRAFGIRRSGNHAVINWIASLFDEPVYFFNNCGFPNCDPYRTGRTNGSRVSTPISNLFVRTGKLKHLDDDFVDAIRFWRKKCLIYSYENVLIDRLKKQSPVGDYKKTIVSSEKIFDIVVLRDVFNWAASHFIYIPHGRRGPVPGTKLDLRDYQKRHKIFQMYKSLAREFLELEDTGILREKKVCISYNDWFSKKEYREKIAAEFGLINRDHMMNEVAGVANRGSKFDLFKFEGRASEMKVLERWKVFKDDDAFWHMLYEDGGEMVDMSNEIFGKII